MWAVYPNRGNICECFVRPLLFRCFRLVMIFVQFLILIEIGFSLIEKDGRFV